MSRWLVLTLVGTCLGAVVMACADPVGPAVDTEQPLVAPRPDAPPLEHVRQHAIEAGMPQEQLEAVLAIARDARPRRRELLGDLDEARAALGEALAAETPDAELVIAAVEALSDVERALRVHNMRTLLAMYDAVDPQWRDVLGTMTPGHPDAAPRGRRP